MRALARFSNLNRPELLLKTGAHFSSSLLAGSCSRIDLADDFFKKSMMTFSMRLQLFTWLTELR
jgi:hypothetical protein